MSSKRIISIKASSNVENTQQEFPGTSPYPLPNPFGPPQLSCNGAVSNIPLRLGGGGRLYLSRHVAYALSGLYDKAGYGNAKNGGYDIYEDPATPVADR